MRISFEKSPNGVQLVRVELDGKSVAVSRDEYGYDKALVIAKMLLTAFLNGATVTPAMEANSAAAWEDKETVREMAAVLWEEGTPT